MQRHIQREIDRHLVFETKLHYEVFPTSIAVFVLHFSGHFHVILRNYHYNSAEQVLRSTLDTCNHTVSPDLV